MLGGVAANGRDGEDGSHRVFEDKVPAPEFFGVFDRSKCLVPGVVRDLQGVLKVAFGSEGNFCVDVEVWQRPLVDSFPGDFVSGVFGFGAIANCEV